LTAIGFIGPTAAVPAHWFGDGIEHHAFFGSTDFHGFLPGQSVIVQATAIPEPSLSLIGVVATFVSVRRHRSSQVCRSATSTPDRND
jgi:hypothetical protein